VYGITIISDDEDYGNCLIYVFAIADNFIGLPNDSEMLFERAAEIAVIGLTVWLGMLPGGRETEQVSAVLIL
jgi:hypothetical protein